MRRYVLHSRYRRITEQYFLLFLRFIPGKIRLGGGRGGCDSEAEAEVECENFLSV
ncbi:MAG TPA: hypothetical protein VEO19_11555 [Terriglobia bacterium]|nr:hypothetical protein [Terriglobia bacterium]